MEHYPLIRTTYLYLFALVGLILLTIGVARFLDMGLKAFVFTKAEQPERIREIYSPIPLEKVENYQETEELVLTEEEKQTFQLWLKDYKQGEKIDYVASKRHREASSSLAMILIGLPLYFYHWRIIRKET